MLERTMRDKDAVCAQCKQKIRVIMYDLTDNLKSRQHEKLVWTLLASFPSLYTEQYSKNYKNSMLYFMKMAYF